MEKHNIITDAHIVVGENSIENQKCPLDMDESVFQSLPLDIQLEVIANQNMQQQQQQQQLKQKSALAAGDDEAPIYKKNSFRIIENSPPSGVQKKLTPPNDDITANEILRSTNYDPDVMKHLPEDIQLELLTLEGENSQTWDGGNSLTWDGDSSQIWNGKNSQTWDLLPQVQPRWNNTASSSSFTLAAAAGSTDRKTQRHTMPPILQSDSQDETDSKDSSSSHYSPTKTPERHTTTTNANATAVECLSTSLVPRGSNRELSTQEEENCICRYIGDHDMFGRRTGQGELRWENGDKFKGLFIKDVRDGPGTLWVHDGSIYEGNWKNDQFDGYGVRKFPSGYVYAGYFQDGKSHGYGKCEFPSGDKYEGDWYDGLMDGLGKYIHKQKGDIYEGMFRQGKRDGPGRYRYKNRRTDVIRYSNGERVGEGVRWSKDGKKAWLLSGKTVVEKLSKEAAMELQGSICGAIIKIMDDSILLHHRECAIHTSPSRKKIVRQETCRVPHMPTVRP